MPKQIILNSNNWNVAQRKFIYNFQSGQSLRDYDVGLSSISIYNSFFNVSASNNNNTFSINWLGTTYNFTMSDGYYGISDMNYYLQQQMVLNNLYLINSNGNYVYYIEILVNSVAYSGEMNFYLIPTSLPSGYSKPSGANWSFPSVAKTPLINISTAFGKLIGFSPDTYPLVSSSASQIVSNITPSIHVVNSLILTCNLINNIGLSNPTNVFFSFGVGEDYGNLISINSSQIVYSRVSGDQFQTIEIQVLDQNFNVLTLLDTDVLISLVLNDTN